MENIMINSKASKEATQSGKSDWNKVLPYIPPI